MFRGVYRGVCILDWWQWACNNSASFFEFLCRDKIAVKYFEVPVGTDKRRAKILTVNLTDMNIEECDHKITIWKSF